MSAGGHGGGRDGSHAGSARRNDSHRSTPPRHFRRTAAALGHRCGNAVTLPGRAPARQPVFRAQVRPSRVRSYAGELAPRQEPRKPKVSFAGRDGLVVVGRGGGDPGAVLGVLGVPHLADPLPVPERPGDAPVVQGAVGGDGDDGLEAVGPLVDEVVDRRTGGGFGRGRPRCPGAGRRGRGALRFGVGVTGRPVRAGRGARGRLRRPRRTATGTARWAWRRSTRADAPRPAARRRRRAGGRT